MKLCREHVVFEFGGTPPPTRPPSPSPPPLPPLPHPLPPPPPTPSISSHATFLCYSPSCEHSVCHWGGGGGVAAPTQNPPLVYCKPCKLVSKVGGGGVRNPPANLGHASLLQRFLLNSPSWEHFVCKWGAGVAPPPTPPVVGHAASKIFFWTPIPEPPPLSPLNPQDSRVVGI